MSKWAPTRKWWAQVTGGLASIAASWIITGEFDAVERGMGATLLAAAVASYWKRNQTPSRSTLKRKAAHVESKTRRT